MIDYTHVMKKLKDRIESLEKSEKYFRSFVEKNADGIIIVCKKGIIKYANPAAAILFDQTKESLLGKTYTYKNREGDISEINFPHKDGSLHRAKIHIEKTEWGDETCNLITLIDITERKLAEEKLKKLEEFNDSIVNGMNIGIVIMDSKGNFIFTNPGIKDLLLFEATELIGENWSKIIPQNQHTLIQEADGRRLKGMSDVYEVDLIRKDGKILTARVIGSPRYQNNNFIGTMAIITDITAQKQIERDLRMANKYSQYLVDNSLDMIIAVDKNRRITEFNGAAETTFGYTKKEVMGKHVNILYANVHEGQKLHEATLEKGECIHEVVNKRKNGETFSSILEASTLLNETGEIIGVMGISRDISDKKAAQQALHNSETKFRNVIEQSNDGIFVLQNNRFVFINPRLTQITGYNQKEVNTDNFDFRQLMTDEGKKVLEECGTLRKYGESQPHQYIFKFLRKDGLQIDLEVSISTVHWEGASATLGMVNNVTERVLSQKKLEEALVKAEQSEKLKNLFLANMSHEIRTPLNSILGFSDLIYDEVKEIIGPGKKIFFEAIKNSGERLLKTIHGVLDISQIEAGTVDFNPEKLSMVGLIRAIIKENKQKAREKGIFLHFDWKGKNTTIKADELMINNALTNLLENAIIYTDKGGVTILLKERENQLILTIQDTGIGISKEYLKHIYDSFSQESMGYTKKYQGLGLGLAIAKRCLDMNEVRIEVESIKGKGTTFTLTFKKMNLESHIKKLEINGRSNRAENRQKRLTLKDAL